MTALSRGCVMPDTPDVAFIQLEYASGVIANVELAWLAPSKLRRTTVVGSQKMVVYDDTSAESVRVFDSGVNLPDPESFGEYRLSYRTGDIVSPRIAVAEPLALELEDFCRAIRTGSALRSTPQLGVEVVRVVEAAERRVESPGPPSRRAPARPGLSRVDFNRRGRTPVGRGKELLVEIEARRSDRRVRRLAALTAGR